MITVGSLFSGIGGLDLGLERAGMTVRWQCERDEFCRGVLAKHWPGVKCYDDVEKVDERAERVDLICGGFPCQPHSLAGKRKGTSDDRDLWPEYRRVVAALKPTWVVGENVPGIYGPFLDGILADLDGFGYRSLVFEIPACAVDAPHRRARVFIVAHAGRERRQQIAESSPCDESEDARRCAEGNHVATGDGEGVLAHGHGHRRESERSGRLLNGQRTTRGDDADGRCEPGGVEFSEGERRSEGRPEPTRQQVRSAASSTSRMGDASRERGSGSGSARGWRRQHPNASAWSDAEWIACGDGKARRVKPGVRLLAHGIPGRVARLKALGNAVVPQVAEVIGRMVMEASGT